MPYVKIQCENLDADAGIEIGGVEFAGLVKNVTDGCYTMSAELIRLKRQISSLERRLRGAHKEYRTLASQYAVSKDAPIYSERARFALDEESESGSGKTHEELVVDAATLYDLYRGQRELNNEVSTALHRGVEAREKIVRMMGWEPATQPPELSPSGDKSGSSDDQGPSNSSDTSYGHNPDKSFSLARGNTVGDRPMKADNSSAPGCPFAATGGRKPSNHASVSTPIPPASPLPTRPRSLPNASGLPDSSQTTHSMAPPAAVELEPSTSQAASVTGSASKCPIRFLDQYSPEQVAQYFQEHKHEVPRSHETCVRRFQTNTESVRHLDAKYGNLVNMIQGLGAKHQPLLPTKEDEDDDELLDSGDGKVIERVETWAENVNGIELDAPIGESADEVKVGEGERENHFERDLKEVRLGESPSRPWGIQIPLQDPADFDGHDEAPVTAGINQRSSAHGIDSTASQVKRESPNKATFHGHDVYIQQNAAFLPLQKPPPLASPNDGELRPQGERSTPQMVFTGPVFIGHSVEQAAEILRMSGLSGGAGKKQT